MFVRITVHYRPRGITSTIAIAIGLRAVYNVVYKGDNNKSAVQKKMKLFRLFFKSFNCFLTELSLQKHTLHEQDKV